MRLAPHPKKCSVIARTRSVQRRRKTQSAKQKSTPANDPWSFVHPLTSEDAAAMTALRSAVAGMKGVFADFPSVIAEEATAMILNENAGN